MHNLQFCTVHYIPFLITEKSDRSWVNDAVNMSWKQIWPVYSHNDIDETWQDRVKDRGIETDVMRGGTWEERKRGSWKDHINLYN